MSVDGTDYQAWVEAQNDAPGDQTAAYFANDFAESSKLDQFYPTTSSGGEKWWEAAAKYGVTRAIDAHFAPIGVDKTTQGASYAGANGRTYTAGAAVTDQAGGGMLPLLILAVVAFAVMG
jgi:hypothetical protein